MSFSDYLDEASEYFLGVNETQSSKDDAAGRSSQQVSPAPRRQLGRSEPGIDPPHRLGVPGGGDLLGVLGAIRRALDARLDHLRTGLRETDTVYSTDPNDYNGS
jgi:hypothetical protein